MPMWMFLQMLKDKNFNLGMFVLIVVRPLTAAQKSIFSSNKIFIKPYTIFVNINIMEFPFKIILFPCIYTTYTTFEILKDKRATVQKLFANTY